MCPTPTGGAWHFSFNVKFYPPDPAQLSEDITRYLKVGYGNREHFGGEPHISRGVVQGRVRTHLGPLQSSSLSWQTNATKWVQVWDARRWQVLRDRLLFPSPWPRGKALRVEMQSPTRHRQNGWDSAINGAAALSGPALEPKLQISFWAYALPVSNLVLHSCLTARERFREGEGTAWIHLRVYLLSRAHKKGKRILRKRSNT